MKLNDDLILRGGDASALVTITIDHSTALTLAASFQILLQNSGITPLACDGQALASAILLRAANERPRDTGRERIIFAQADAYSALFGALGESVSSQIKARISEGFGSSASSSIN